VPGAACLPPDAIRDANGPPTFLPAPAVFEQMMAALGISNATRVIACRGRGQGSQEHPEGRVRAVLGRGLLGPPRSPAENLQAGRRDPDDLRGRGILRTQEVIAYSQVGIRASVDLFALRLVGYGKLRNHYGAGRYARIA
jgi:3-mercaptopyruvate sulfurtransferase SseA